ncbi:hypothetical protein EV121DRAFT_297403 [Schizophyllum commune]
MKRRARNGANPAFALVTSWAQVGIKREGHIRKGVQDRLQLHRRRIIDVNHDLEGCLGPADAGEVHKVGWPANIAESMPRGFASLTQRLTLIPDLSLQARRLRPAKSPSDALADVDVRAWNHAEGTKRDAFRLLLQR